MLSASSAVSAYQCAQLLGERYVRVDGTLPRSLMKLDETSHAYVRNLKGEALRWYEVSYGAIHDLIRKYNNQKNSAGPGS